ncbi:SHOCT domain-containing protein [Fusibacter bizertensis]
MIRENYKKIQKNGTLYIIMGLTFIIIAAFCMLLTTMKPTNSNALSLVSILILLVGLLMTIYGYKMMVSERIKREEIMKENLPIIDFEGELQELEKLREAGLISEEEFAIKRKEIMDSQWG